MLDFLKKKNQSDSVSSLDNLPPAPKPNSSPTNVPAQDVANEPYIPPIPESDTPAPPPPSSMQSGTFAQAAPFEQQVQEKDEELEPLPNAPNIPDDLTKESPDDAVAEPSPLTDDASKPISPKDIDPRDRFDDIIKLEQTPELPAPDQTTDSITESAEEVQQPAPITSQIESEKEITPPEEPELPVEEHEDLELPSADELAAKLGPVINRSPEPQSLPDMPTITGGKLPSFGEAPVFEDSVIHTKGSDPEFELPDMRMGGPKPVKELSLFVTVNDYALVTQTMRKLLRFFKKSSDTLGLTDQPEKVQVLHEMYKELNTAQKHLMEVDKKLFERDS